MILIGLNQYFEADFLWEVSDFIAFLGIQPVPFEFGNKSQQKSSGWENNSKIGKIVLGVTIVAKNYYCDSIDIAGSTIAILSLLWTTIAILL